MQNSVEQWRIFFYISAAIFLFGGIVFLILGKGEPIDWMGTPGLINGIGSFKNPAPSIEPAPSIQIRVEEPNDKCETGLPESGADFY